MTTSVFNSIRDDPIRTASSFFVCNNRLPPASNQTPWEPGNRIGAIISPGLRGSRFNLIDVKQSLKANPFLPALLGIAMLATVPGAKLSGLNAPAPADPPPSGGGFFPLSEVHRGQIGTAWTVFSGTRPEPMQVEILGVLRGARGPGHDMILAQLHGAKPEYTGVVAGMSGSPVYIGDKLLGSLSYRIGQFSKDPIAGITPIEQMLEVRDRPAPTMRASVAAANPNGSIAAAGMNFQAMETPLVMSGFRPEAIQLWQKKMAGTGLEMVAAGGGSGSSKLDPDGSIGAISPVAIASIVPGSAVSAQLIRGDLEISATCTVTYMDPKQLLACGHPILQAGPVSLPMTTAEVVDTLASPLNAFKIINTGDTIGAFTEDRDSAILGVLGSKPHMIPVHITVHGEGHDRKLNIEVLDLPSLTPQAVLVALYKTLLESNQAARKPAITSGETSTLTAIRPRRSTCGHQQATRGQHNCRLHCRLTSRLRASMPTERVRARCVPSIWKSMRFHIARRWSSSRHGWTRATSSTLGTPWWWKRRCVRGSRWNGTFVSRSRCRHG